MISKLLSASLLASLSASLPTLADKGSQLPKSPRKAAVGYVQITVPGHSLQTVAATLENRAAHTSSAAVGNYDPMAGTQTLTVADAEWSPGQWSPSTGPGYLAFICDSIGGEEAFLILSNTDETVTIQTGFDLLDEARLVPNVTDIRISLAHTISSLFGTGGFTDLTVNDRLYLWNGSGWTTYFLGPSGDWFKVGSFRSANDDILFPDEGFFVQRNEPSSVTFTFVGEVPPKVQVSTIPGPGLTAVSSRYPVETVVERLGFHKLAGWIQGTNGDKIYVWKGDSWDTYFYNFDNTWRKIGSFDIHNTDPIAPDTVVFVSRTGTSSPVESANWHILPYAPFAGAPGK